MTEREEALAVARTIRAFLEGAGADWDWDDFTSCSLKDPLLDRIRVEALAVALPCNAEGFAKLTRLAEKAEQLGRP